MSGDAGASPGRVLVLLSGGVDSSACVAFYLDKRFDVACLFVDYGHPAAVVEQQAAVAITEHYGVHLQISRINGLPARKSGFVPARNALLVFTALACAEPERGLVALGIHSGTPYPDCTPRFVDACQALADVYAEGRVRIAAPFVTWTKGDIFTYAKKVGVPLDSTYSCEAGGATPCGTCLSCQDLERWR